MTRTMQPIRYSEPTGDVVYINGVLHSVRLITDDQDNKVEYNFLPIDSVLEFNSISEAMEGYAP